MLCMHESLICTFTGYTKLTGNMEWEYSINLVAFHVLFLRRSIPRVQRTCNIPVESMQPCNATLLAQSHLFPFPFYYFSSPFMSVVSLSAFCSLHATMVNNIEMDIHIGKWMEKNCTLFQNIT